MTMENQKTFYMRQIEEKIMSFFSTSMLNLYFAFIWLTGLVMLLFWPKQNISGYIESQTEPVCFTACFISTILILSYANMRCGRGELQDKVDGEKEDTALFYKKQSVNFLVYCLTEFTIHNIIMLMITAPFFILAASVSGKSLITVELLTITIFITSMLFRLVGFTARLYLKNWNNLSYILTRIVFFLFFFLSSKFSPPLNPLYTIYGVSKGLQKDFNLFSGPFSQYFIMVVLAALFFIFLDFFMIGKRKSSK